MSKYPEKKEYRLTIEYDEDGIPIVHIYAPGYDINGQYLVWPHVQQPLADLASALDGRDEYGSVIVWDEAAPDETLMEHGA